MTSPTTPEALTAAELDDMSPDERAEALRSRIIDDPAQLPANFRRRVEETARNLGTPTSQAQ